MPTYMHCWSGTRQNGAIKAFFLPHTIAHLTRTYRAFTGFRRSRAAGFHFTPGRYYFSHEMICRLTRLPAASFGSLVRTHTCHARLLAAAATPRPFHYNISQSLESYCLAYKNY